MARIYIPSRGPDDWRGLLASDTHWSAGRSAMTAALCWEAARGLPAEIAAMLGPRAELLLAIPEHKVDMPGGGRASQCDVFALVGTADGLCALAVEAKVDEPFGPTCGEWLAVPSDRRMRRLSTICAMLAAPYPPPPELRYQLFHRTAAAVLEARRFRAATAAMVVHSFSREHRWFEDFAAFCSYLGADAVRGEAVRLPHPDGISLVLGWATGSEAFLRACPARSGRGST